MLEQLVSLKLLIFAVYYKEIHEAVSVDEPKDLQPTPSLSKKETKQVVSAEVKRSSGSLAAGQESKDIQSLVSFQEVQRVSPPRHQKMSKRLSLSASGLAYY